MSQEKWSQTSPYIRKQIVCYTIFIIVYKSLPSKKPYETCTCTFVTSQLVLIHW